MKKTTDRLLAWYDGNGRTLPWRVRNGKADPYKVWLSEIMLQQTTAAAVVPYYEKFIARWPDVFALAAAARDDVLAAWAGLGYYARARNLHAAAGVVAAAGGRFPDTLEGLRALPGIGAYTAGAIGAIAFGLRTVAMDANAERVIARLFAVEEPLPAAKPKLYGLAEKLVPPRAGDFAQALMDLGAGPCSIRAPRCDLCPVCTDCLAARRGIAETLPKKAPRSPKPRKRGAAFVGADAAGRLLLVRRPAKGVLASMWQPPLSWSDDFPTPRQAMAQAPCAATWRKVPGLVRHGFTHFDLEIEVYVAVGAITATANAGAEVRWVARDALQTVALPTLMRKILAHAETLAPLSGKRGDTIFVSNGGGWA